MGCEIVVGGARPSELLAVEALFAERDRRFSRFRDDSELNHVNASRAPLLVSEEFASALTVALEAAAATDGLAIPRWALPSSRPATTGTSRTSKRSREPVGMPTLRRAAGRRFG
jgi:hypothetical protein